MLSAFADALEYPGADLVRRLDSCLDRLPAGFGDARRLIETFREEAVRLGSGRLEERYTAAFDLDAECTLDVGHHLFGHDPRRAVFLSRLVEEYRETGFRPSDAASPDHLPEVLRYVQSGVDGRRQHDLLQDAVFPAAGRIAEALERRHHPYAPLLRALMLILAARCAPGTAAEGAPL